LRQAIPRLLRRQRRTLFTAVVALVVVVATTTVVLINAHQTLQALGSHKLGRMWDDPERRAVRFQRPNAPRLLQPDESHVETAVHALKEYDLLDSDQWRTRDDVRTLPKAERDDLEVWLGEQVYMYCRALEKRPDSPDDWRRALKVLGHFAGPSPIPALAQLQHLLRDHLGAGDALSPRAPGDLPRSARLFSVNEYLLGVVAESAAELPDQAPPAKVGKNADTRSPEIALDRPYPDRPRIVAERALHHYNNFLELRPDSFWGHYRAASVAYGLGGKAHIAEAANHLDQCLTRRSNNPTLHHHRAVCLIGLDQYREAHREVQIAIEQAPDVAEFYRTRATIRANLRVTGELATDLRHFELLTHLLPRAFWGHVPVGPDHSAGSSDSSVLPFEGLFALGADLGGRAAESKGNIIEAGPGEFEIRVGLATAIRQAGEFDLAEVEFAKILLLEPDHIGVRMTCAMQAVDSGRLDEALPQLNAILNHPDLIEYLRNEVVVMGVLDRRNERTLLDLFYNASRLYCHHGKLNEGRAIARRAVDLAIALHRPRGMAHFNLARAYAASVPSSSEYVGLAATQLFCAFVANPLYKVQYANDSTFDAVRTSIDAELVRKPDSAAEYHRRHKTKTKVQAR
jgi:tetratricopeptide (TPR) repeat protein